MPKTVVCLDIQGNKHTVSVNDLQWRPSAYGIVVKDGAVLLAKQYGGYDIPGGGIDLGESPEEAVLREIKEETGITAQNPRLITVSTSFFKMPDTTSQFVEALLMYYVCEYEGGEISLSYQQKNEQKHSELAEWVPMNEFDHRITKDAIAGSYDWRKHVKEALAR